MVVLIRQKIEVFADGHKASFANALFGKLHIVMHFADQQMPSPFVRAEAVNILDVMLKCLPEVQDRTDRFKSGWDCIFNYVKSNASILGSGFGEFYWSESLAKLCVTLCTTSCQKKEEKMEMEETMYTFLGSNDSHLSLRRCQPTARGPR